MQKINRGWWWTALVLTILGISASFYLTSLHFQTLKSGFSGMTLCNINEYINCDMVVMSRFSEILGIPLAGLGLIFYLYLLGALFYARLAPETSQNTLALPYLFIIFSFILSLLLAYESTMHLRALCIFCLSLYVINFLLLISFKKVVPMKVKAWFSQLNGAAWVKNFAYFSIIFIVGILLLYSNHKQYARDIPQAKINQYVDAFFQQPKVDIDTAGRPFWGNPDAKISIVEFSDFECPYCQKAAFTLKPLLANYRDKVKLVFINYPLDRSCNTAMERDLHEYACQAAYANHCAAEQGKFWEYHDESFKKQPRFKPEDLKKVAQKTKLDMDKFNSCMTAESTAEYIQKDLEQGKLAGIHGTPAIFVNGRPFQPWFFKNAWDSLITRLESNSQ